MAFVDMPKSVETVMYKLFAPEFDVNLEEIEDTLNILNLVQDDVKKDERGKVLQALISVISGEAVADDFKQAIMKNHQSVYLKPDLAQSLIYLVKEVTENKEHPSLCQPLIPRNWQNSKSLMGSENKSIFLPNYWHNSSVNFKDEGGSNMMEQVVQGATNLKDGQECENHSLLIPGCAKFPLSRVMYKQEQTDTMHGSGQYQARMRVGCYPEKVQIADCWNASEQFIDKECSWNFMENSSTMTNLFEETTPMRSTVSIDKYYNMDGGVSPLTVSNKERHETKNQQKRVLSRTAKYPKTNEVLLHKVGSNCIMVAVKDKTNRFILPKPESRIPMDKNDIRDDTVPCKGISANSKARKRHGIDVMALCGGHKVGKMSVCNSRSPRGKASQLNIRKAFEPKNTRLECFKGVGKSTRVGHLKQGWGPYESVQERFSPLSQNDNWKVEKGFSETVWVELGSKEGHEVISSPFSGGLRPSSLKKTAITERAEVDSLLSKSNEETLLQQSHVGDLEAVDRVGKDKATAVTGQGTIIEDEEEDPDVLIIDEDPPVVLDLGGNDCGEKSGGSSSDAMIIDNTGYWNGQCWILAGKNQGQYSDQPGSVGNYCEQAVSSMEAGQGKVLKHQGQISQSYLESDSLPLSGPNVMHVRMTSSSSEVDFKETDSQSNASDASSPDASSSADSLSLSQGSDGGSFTAPGLPEYSFLFNLLKCHDEMETKDDLCKFSWKKILPKKKGKPRRSRRTRRARATYQN